MFTVYLISASGGSGQRPCGPATTWKKKKLIGVTGLIDAIVIFRTDHWRAVCRLVYTYPGRGHRGGGGHYYPDTRLHRQLHLGRGYPGNKGWKLRLILHDLLLIAGATVFGHFITRTAMPHGNWPNG